MRERERGGDLSWGAIWGGTAVGLGLWVLLGLFGVWIWFVALNNANGARIWLFVWTLIVPLVCMPIGAAVSSMGAGPSTRGRGILHGFAAWGSMMFLMVLAVLAGSFFFSQGALGAGPVAAINSVLGLATAGSVTTGASGVIVRLTYYIGFLTLSCAIACVLCMGAGLLGAQQHDVLIERDELLRRERREEEFHAPH